MRCVLFCLALLVPAALSTTCSSTHEMGSRPGKDAVSFVLNQSDPSLCKQACCDRQTCLTWVYVPGGLYPHRQNGSQPTCWLKDSVQPKTANTCDNGVAGCISGVLARAPLNADTFLKFAASQLNATLRTAHPPTAPTDKAWPGATALKDGRWTWNTVAATNWVSGFFPSLMWQMYNSTKIANWRHLAESWQAMLKVNQDNRATHDVGFIVLYTFGKQYDLIRDPEALNITLNTANSLASRFNAKVGMTMSWQPNNNWMFPVILDNMMNLELFFWAADQVGRHTTQGKIWFDMAVSHADRTFIDFFRQDGSSFHVVDYDPNTGAVRGKYTWPQGLRDPTTTWSRGQAWAIYGYAMAYRFTRYPRYLEFARTVTDYFLAHLPDDFIVMWDFQAPDTELYRDTSAAAVTAAGLIELADYVQASKAHDAYTVADSYRAFAKLMLQSLSTPAYLCDPKTSPAILAHAVGSLPEGSQVDVSLIYGDYYYVEALLRAKARNWA